MVLSRHVRHTMYPILEAGVKSRADFHAQVCNALGVQIPFSVFQQILDLLPDIRDVFRPRTRYVLPSSTPTRTPTPTSDPTQMYFSFHNDKGAPVDSIEHTPPDMQLPRVVAHDTPTLQVIVGGGPPPLASGPTRPHTNLMDSPFATH